MAEGTSRKKSRKSKDSSDSSSDSDSDYDIHAEISSAMREVEKAMKQVKIATKGSKMASKDKDRIQLSQERAAMSREKAERARQMAASAETSGAEKGEFVQSSSTGDSKENGKQGGTNGGTNVINVNKNMFIRIENAQNIQVGSHNTMVVNVNGTGRSQRRSSSRSSENGLEKEQQAQNCKDEPQLTDHARRVLESERSPNQADFNIVCGYLGNEWRRFFRYLDFTDDEIEQQYISYHPNGIREVIFNSLKKWEEKKGRDAKVCHLAKAFQRLGRIEALLKFEP